MCDIWHNNNSYNNNTFISRDNRPIIGISRLSAVLPIIGIGRLLRRYRPIIIYTLGKYKFLLSCVSCFNFVWWMFVRVCIVFVSLTVFVFLFIACDSCITLQSITGRCVWWCENESDAVVSSGDHRSRREMVGVTGVGRGAWHGWWLVSDRPRRATHPHATPLATPHVSIVNDELYSVNCGLLSCFWNFLY